MRLRTLFLYHTSPYILHGDVFRQASKFFIPKVGSWWFLTCQPEVDYSFC